MASPFRKVLIFNVEFWLPDSEWHTKAHCARVLLLALLIGHQKGLSDEEMDAHQPNDPHFELWTPHNIVGTEGQQLYG